MLFTDLDGTLLDHDSYSWKAASSAILELKNRNIPIILNSSKTFVELQSIADDLDLNSPLICENGSIVAVNYNNKTTGINEYAIHRFATPYQELVNIIDQIRTIHKFNFTGFHDMTVEDVVSYTGLSNDAANAASQREATEPLLWNDTQQQLEEFSYLLKQKGLSITRGGRFYHVMSPVDKGLAVKWLIDYLSVTTNDNITIGLGDSVNDLSMLQIVDYPVLIKNVHSPEVETSHLKNIIKTELSGPAGWNQAVLTLIELLTEEN